MASITFDVAAQRVKSDNLPILCPVAPVPIAQFNQGFFQESGNNLACLVSESIDASIASKFSNHRNVARNQEQSMVRFNVHLHGLIAPSGALALGLRPRPNLNASAATPLKKRCGCMRCVLASGGGQPMIGRF